MLLLLVKGLILGFAVAAPVGPIGVLCLRRSIALGQKHGFLTGLGAAVADGFYGAVAAFGLTWISDELMKHQSLLQLGGGAFMAILAVMIWRSPVQEVSSEKEMQTSAFASFLSAVMVTMTNPATVFAFLAAFVAFDLRADSTAGACVMTAGVFVGSGIWWLFLSWISSRVKSLMTASGMKRINRITGGALFVFSAAALAKGLASF